MTPYGRLPRGFRLPWSSRRRIANEVDEEISFHLEMRVARLVHSGMNPDDAKRQALREFGDVDELRRSMRRGDERAEKGRRRRSSLEWVAQDIRIALRSLWRSPGFTVMALATLALGIGASVALFTVLNAVLLRPLPYPEPDRLVQLSPGQNFNIALVDAVVEGAPSLEAATGLSWWGLTLTGQGDPVELEAQFVDAGFFRVFGVQPALGRPFRPEERDPVRSGVVILSHKLWQGRFGGDPHIVGRIIELDGSGHTRRQVVGVMPEGFVAPLARPDQRIDLWAPLSRAHGRTVATDSTWYVNALVGRLRAGATVDGAAREVRATMVVVRNEFGNILGEETERTAGAAQLLESMVGEVHGTLLILLAAVGLVLLLACANVANLLLARNEGRRQELAVRAALGASRGRLVRELLVGSTVLGVLGGVAGVVIARLILSALQVSSVSGLPRTGEFELDLRVLGFAIVVSLASVLGFGLLPALRASGGNLRLRVGAGGRTRGHSRAGRRLGFTLITAEVALAMVVVTGAGLLLNSLRALHSVDPGMDTSDVLSLALAPPPGRYEGERAVLYYEEVLERLRTLPGVRGAGAVQILPFTSNNWGFPYLADGHLPPADAPLPLANFRVVTPGYFEAVDIPLLAGRSFDAADRAEGPAVGMINRALADRLWPGEEAIGRTIQLFGNNPFRVVGVVGDVHQHALERPPEPEIYFPLRRWPLTRLVVMVESDVEPASLARAAAHAVWEIDENVPITAARPLAEVLGASMQRQRFVAGTLSLFAALALLLGAVGVYGVMVQVVGVRIPEFGLRMALGASAGQVARSAFASGLVPVGTGLALGAFAALIVTSVLSGLLYGVGPRDPLTLVVAALAWGGVAALASWVPARRASRVDPSCVLRGD